MLLTSCFSALKGVLAFTVSPILFATLNTWVSTAIVGRPKQTGIIVGMNDKETYVGDEA